MSLKPNKTERATEEIVTLTDTQCKDTLHGSKEDVLKPNSDEPVKSEVSIEPLIVADQRDDIPMETDELINNFQSKPSNEAIPNIQEKENVINIESTIQEENITVRNNQELVPQKITSLVDSNSAHLSVNQRVHESKEEILKPNSIVPVKSEVSLVVTDQGYNIPIEVDKLIPDTPRSSGNEAKLKVQEKENAINIEKVSLEENITVNNIQKTVPQKISSKVESNNEQLTVNQRVPLEGGTLHISTNRQEKAMATEKVSFKAPSEISTAASEERELKISSPIKSSTSVMGKLSEHLDLKLSKELSSNESGEKEKKIKSLDKISKQIEGPSVLKQEQLVDNLELNISETKYKVNQQNMGVLKERQDFIVEDTSVEDQPRWTSSEESLPDLEMDTSDISILNEDLVNKIKKISNEIAEKVSPGKSVQEVTAHLSTEDVKILKKPEAQVALFNAAQRIYDKPKIIQNQIVKEISMNSQNTETFGTRALLFANEIKSNKKQDVTSFFEPKDFDCSKTRTTLCEILNHAQNLKSKKPQTKNTSSRIDNKKYMEAIKSLVVESKKGKPVNEIISEKQPKDVENMQCIESQMAMIAVVEKLGYEKETEDVVLEQLNSDRVGMLNIVGTKALMSVMKDKPYSIDEIMKQFNPDDFQHDKVQERVTKILNVAKAVNQKVENGTHHARL